MKFKEIINTGITSTDRNGARNQEIIWQVNTTKEKFRIFIHSESYDFQSYARLYKWDNNKGWNVITTVNPEKDFNVRVAYKNPVNPGAFLEIIAHLRKIAKTFIDEDNPNISSGSN
jgi:hypothetical protein